ncbi:M1 family metallopeptidase [Chryseobacterium gallinarum]|uniref:M1 family metallopeptidase n=1 Tax=Chryseobacterium gallinarum TaxID=1324352 RepID=A0A0G3MBJ4_CHRGL|nr:M1 family metallopeptidase [Chryseobacterium gallinarum]AKK74482.1 peptidase M1 [Chryseobacterium gallinarum]MCL8538310.1 M1 family metallopeptidase [Chryseobacterium gallinarum]QIY89722.1 M1 family metallopeptidase [Chryseobacterium gallinarum]
MKKLSYTLILASGLAFGQFFEKDKVFTRQDTLKGSNTQFRNFWDVKKYDLSVEPDFAQKSIRGNNKISFEIIKDITNPVFQIDLQQPMKADKVEGNFSIKDWKQEGDFIFITANKKFKKGEKYTIDVTYSGNPLIAKNAPWDGGWVFTKDEKGNPWMSVADEGIGASIWLPTKDIWSDEPDNGIIMKIITPNDLVGVGNGRLIDKKTDGNKTTYTWQVKNPINAYSIIPNIGKYVNFKDTFNGEKGKLDLDYWVLDYNLDKAQKQFQQVKPMISAFEYWFGPYPFYEDSYKLVDSPYLGMEHQSNVAYGNGYQNGYRGKDLSGTGIGLKWDYIIIHESGHEWFANNITAKDQADMWIHESFTMYSEVLFTEKFLDKKSADVYMIGLRNVIQNDVPIIGQYGVRNEGSGDMYPKGANMLHTIRQVINNDEKFRQILRGLSKEFYHQTVTTKQIEDYISAKSGIDFSSVFNQYLRTIKIPTLEYSQNGDSLKFRYTDVVENLKLPVIINGDQTITPTESWQTVKLKKNTPVELNPNYYIHYKNVQ